MSRKSKDSTPVKAKLTVVQLQDKLEKQEEVIRQLQEDASNKNSIKMLEKKVVNLEGQIILNKSLDFVRARVTEELKSQLVDLQQYTREDIRLLLLE